MKTKDIKNQIRKKRKKNKFSSKDFLSTGSTMLNLACTGHPDRGFIKGKYYFIVGDSISGKTFLSLTCLAEASINSNFDNYRFIYDDTEGGAMMDIKKFFGEKVSKRMESPNWLHNRPLCSTTIEDFYYNVDDAIKDGRPFIYILDSMDGLSSEVEGSKFDKTKKAHRKGKEEAGSYGDGKAKFNSANLRRLLAPLKKSKSILIIINQTRDNIGFGFEKKTRSGGRALKFYACLEIWSSVFKKITKTVRDKKRQLGTHCKIQIKKNRITGREQTIFLPIYYSMGIDDIGYCIDYLLAENYWTIKKSIIKAEDFDFEGSRKKLIQLIEKDGMEKDLKMIVWDVWKEIDEACKVERKKKYE